MVYDPRKQWGQGPTGGKNKGGAVVGTLTGQTPWAGALVDQFAGHPIGNSVSGLTGGDEYDSANRRMGEALGESEAEYGELSALNPRYDQASKAMMKSYKSVGSKHVSGIKGAEFGYQQQLGGLLKEAETAGEDARKVYTNTVQPNLKNILDDSQREAASAMTLEQSMDPNNSVAASFRNFYDQQAQGARQAGMADVGVMQALGAQAFGGQMGAGGPMTGGQMAAMMGQNQSQAGMAMANTQRRVQDLRDQGIAEGWRQTDTAYGRGQDAKDRYRQSVGDVSGAQADYQDLRQGLREERTGYGQERLGSKTRALDTARDYGMGKSSLGYGLAQEGLDRDAGLISKRRGDRRSTLTGQAQMDVQKGAGKQGILGGILQGLMGGLGKAAGSA